MIDYVIVHELIHGRDLRHRPMFWDAVRVILPDFAVRKQWPRDHGAELGGTTDNRQDTYRFWPPQLNMTFRSRLEYLEVHRALHETGQTPRPWCNGPGRLPSVSNRTPPQNSPTLKSLLPISQRTHPDP